MASAIAVKFTTFPTTAFTVGELKQQSVDVASEVLQKNHDEHNLIHNDHGFRSAYSLEHWSL